MYSNMIRELSILACVTGFTCFVITCFLYLFKWFESCDKCAMYKVEILNAGSRNHPMRQKFFMGKLDVVKGEKTISLKDCKQRITWTLDKDKFDNSQEMFYYLGILAEKSSKTDDNFFNDCLCLLNHNRYEQLKEKILKM
jgi:hypothetical protein